tara:strand:- start:873 stop:1520 length:648 start_codon:yes stop_codon:yes gene_type:complete
MENLDFEKRIYELTNNYEYLGLHKSEYLIWFINKVNSEKLGSYDNYDDWDALWYVLMECYQHAENIHDAKGYLEEIMIEFFETDSVLRAVALSDKLNGVDDTKALKEIWSKGEITVYRGSHTEDRLNLSWTTDKDLATWFATRFWFPKHMMGEDYRGLPVLHTGKVYGGNVYIYTNSRDEKECLIPRPEEFIYELDKEMVDVSDKIKYFEGKERY